jgi:hypothetical protein
MLLDATLVENFAGVFLSTGYDDPQPTPLFHRECWTEYCSDEELVAVAAPRGHAKSTALTYDFSLAAVCFRFESHVMIVSSSEKLAMAQLVDVANELRENDDLRREFGIQTLEKDSEGEIICKCDDGHRFRIIARGVEQRVRGTKWNNRRPGLIICDDIEEDEQVASPDRRRKLANWVNRAMIPAGRRGARIRWHGTILHRESMLSSIMREGSGWKSLFYKAHESFDDFTNILWPEAFDIARLKKIRQRFIAKGDSAGYCQEYLNDPRDDEIAYLKKEWFDPMEEQDYDSPGILGAAIDFAISKADKANRTSITVGKMDINNCLCFVGQSVGKLDSLEIVDEMIDVQKRWKPDFFWVESGQIWLAIKPLLRKECLRKGVYINFIERTPIKDKAARGRSLQRRMKCGGTRWDKEAEWYPSMEEELLNFSELAEAQLDDQFDSAALLSLGFEETADVEYEDLEEDEVVGMRLMDPRNSLGRNRVTGY